ncbi:MAG: hypothetical protein NC541_15525 [bacterium]|nr:hypothetical protein [bacterium]
MNDNHLQQIFARYIDRFEEINNSEHQEYFKWQIVKRFRREMDEALSAPEDEFFTRLREIRKLSKNLIDNYTQPFGGLVKYAEKEPSAVREMFRELYADDGGDLAVRQQKILTFLRRSHALRDKNNPDSYLYKDDMHSVTGYLFLYDPDHNYIFKATHAQIFADCIEFDDDWGSGESVKLDVYYRMCDRLVEEIMKSKALLSTDAGRFSNGWGVDPDTLYPDPEKHVLAFDLIYCCSTYGLFDHISFVRPKTRERQLIQERREKAKKLSDSLKQARNRLKAFEDAAEYINSVFCPGAALRHKSYGTGTITENTGRTVTVQFAETGEKRLGTFISAANGIIQSDAPEYDARIAEYKDCLKSEISLQTAVSRAEKELAPYTEYLE